MKRISAYMMIKFLHEIGYENEFKALLDYYNNNPSLTTLNHAYSNIFANLIKFYELSKELGIDTKQAIHSIKPYIIKHDIPKPVIKAYLIFPEINIESLLIKEIIQNPQALDRYLEYRRYVDEKELGSTLEEIAKNYKSVSKLIEDLDRLDVLDKYLRFKIINYLIGKNLFIDIGALLNLTPDYLIPIMFRKPVFLLLDLEKYKDVIHRIEILFQIENLKDKEFTDKIYEAGFKGQMNPLLKSYLIEGDNYLFELKILFASHGIPIDWYKLLKNLKQRIDIDKINEMISIYKHKKYPVTSIFDRQEFYKGDVEAIRRLKQNI